MQSNSFRFLKDNFIVVITGGTGYIGRHLIASLIDNNIPVVSIQRSSENEHGTNNFLIVSTNDTLKQQIEKIQSFSSERNIIVIHLAALYIKNHSFADINNLIDSNVKLTAEIAELSRELDIKLFLNIGTNWEFGSDGKLNPANLYAATKLAGSSLMKYYERFFQVRYIKLFDTFGGLDNRKKLMPYLKESIPQRCKIELTQGNQTLHLVYIQDVIENLVRICEHSLTSDNKNNYPYFMKSDRPVRLEELVSLINNILGYDLDVSWRSLAQNSTNVEKPFVLNKNDYEMKYLTGLKAGLSKYLLS